MWKRKRYQNVWPLDEIASEKPKGWTGWPERKQFTLVLQHDVDTFKGHEECRGLMELEEKMGFRSSFNFVPERYPISSDLRQSLVERGFEIGVHGLKHDGKLFLSREEFQKQAVRIRRYLDDWQSVGFVSPSMHRNLDWICELGIEHDTSTFDTDPFEPQPDGVKTIFPFWVTGDGQAATASAISLTPGSIGAELQPATRNQELVTRNLPLATRHSSLAAVSQRGFVELPYTLPQDFTLFILMKEKNIDIWKKKLDWIVERGGMALLITHPDYMNCNKGRCRIEEYPMKYYEEFLDYIKDKYEGQFWSPLPKEMARFWKGRMMASKL